jgi:hypothetical protein
VGSAALTVTRLRALVGGAWLQLLIAGVGSGVEAVCFEWVE